MKNIYLIGFMGAGKSHVGRRLADALNRPFMDLDDLIEAKAGESISSVFAEQGEDYFRALERDCLHATAHQKDAIVACGGGTPCFFDNIAWINANGISIYLEASPAIIAERLRQEMAHRPILKGLQPEELEDFVAQKLADRAPFYEQASIRYHLRSADDPVAQELIEHYQEIVGH